jgi:hypothetical protein
MVVLNPTSMTSYAVVVFCWTFQIYLNLVNPIPTGHGRNQPIYECHVTATGRNRVKHTVLYDFNKFLSTVCLISGNNHCHVPMFLTSKKPHGLIDELALSTSMTSVVKYQL